MQFTLLLKPALWSTKNRFFPPGIAPWRTFGIALFSLLICLALYLVSCRVVGYFHKQNELGIILSLKIMQMAWIILFAMLVFSCMVSAVSTIFLSQDNEIIFSAPVNPRQIYWMRYVTTSVTTGWMMIVFCLPIFAAYGSVFKAGPLFWVILTISIIGVAASATAFGTLTTVALVNLFPARRTKDIILYLSLCFGIFIYIMFRIIRPEDLINPDKYGHFVDYLSSISTPAGPYLPAAWAANLLSLFLMDHQIDWLLFSLIIITPVALFFIGEYLMERWFFRGYTKSQESFGGYRRFRTQKNYTPRAWQWVLAKEFKTFLRDSAEWSQVFMIAALVVVYLYNFKMLPVERTFFEEEYVTNLISFLNIGLTGFMVASLSARFVYPAIGAEGGAFYIIKASPVSMGRFMLQKYLIYGLPFTIFSLLLVMASDHLLSIKGPMWWISVGSILIITWVVVGLAIGFGAIYADFKAENRAAALGGIGAILFLFTAMAYELAVIGSAFLPAYRIITKWLKNIPPSATDYWLLALWLVFTLVSGAGLTLYFFRNGLKKLQNSG